MAKSIVEEKSFLLAIQIVNLYKKLKDHHKEFVLSKQLLRCGSSIGANIAEALQGFSKKDFVNKLTIALKEANETVYWLRLMKETNYLNETDYENTYNSGNEIIKILTSIIKTSRENLNKQ